MGSKKHWADWAQIFLVVDVHELITPFTFGDDQFRGFGLAKGQICLFSYTLKVVLTTLTRSYEVWLGKSFIKELMRNAHRGSMRWSNMSVFCFSSISSAVRCSTMLSRLSAYFSSLCSMLSIMSNFLQRENYWNKIMFIRKRSLSNAFR